MVGKAGLVLTMIIFYENRQEAVNLINANYFQMSFNGLSLDLKFHFSFFAN